MKFSNLKYLLTLLLVGLFLFPNNTFAQDDKKVKKKVVITKKTIDKDGNETIEKIVKEGEDIDIDELIKSAENEKGNVEVDVEVTTDGEAAEDGNEKNVTVTVEGNQVKIIDGDEVEIIQIEDGDGTQEIKTADGKHIVIKRNSAEGEDLDIGEMMQDIDVKMKSDGTKEIRIVKIEGPAPDENGAFLGVMIDPSDDGLKLLNAVEGSPAQKAGLQKGDVLLNIDGKAINTYKELTETLSKYKPEDSIVIVYNRNETMNKARVKLVKRGDVAGAKEMIWKSEDGTVIEIDGDQEMHFHGKDKDGKVKKEKIIIKKKIKKEKE